MASAVVCPKCKGPIDVSNRDAEGRIVCTTCGARLITQRPQPGPAAPQPSSPAATPSTPGASKMLAPSYQPTMASQQPQQHRPAGVPRRQRPLTPTEKRNRFLMIGGVVAGGFLLMIAGVVVILVVMTVPSSSDDRESSDNFDGGFMADAFGIKGEERRESDFWAEDWVVGELPSQPVSFETPVPDVGKIEGESENLTHLSKAEPFDEALHQPRTNPVVESLREQRDVERRQSEVEPETFEDEARWQAEADPSLEETDFLVAENIRIEPRGPEHPFTMIRAAQRGGPFVLLPPTWENTPEKHEYAVPPEDNRYAPIEVMDVRTGDVVGTFDWRIPFHMGGALSPDGKQFLSSFWVPVHSSEVKDGNSDLIGHLNKLYIWTRDSDLLPLTLPTDGYSSWFGFIDESTVATLLESPTRRLQIWDLSTSQRTLSIDLPEDERYRLSEDSIYGLAQQRYWQRSDVAISPGGRFAAVVTGATITMISMESGEILGSTVEFLPTGKREPIQGLSFTPDGTELVVAYPGKGVVHLMKLSATDGRRLMQQPFDGIDDANAENGWGPIVPGPRDGSWLHLGRKTYAKGTGPVYYEFGRPNAVSLIWDEILACPSQGNLLVTEALVKNSRRHRIMTLDRQSLQQMISTAFGDPIGPAVTVDRSEEKLVESSPPESWQSMVDMAPVARDEETRMLPTAPWRVSWGNEKIAAIFEVPWQSVVGRPDRTIDYLWILDRSTGRPLQEPVELHRWVKTRYEIVPPRSIALAPDDTHIVLNDPQYLHRLNVWSTEGAWLFGFEPFEEETVVEWIQFDAAGRLLVAGGGSIASFNLGDRSAKALFTTTDSHYLPPYRMGPQRQRLIASRGHSLDILDLSNGQVINRMGIQSDSKNQIPLRMITDYAISPDGKRAAMMYGAKSLGEAALRHSSRSSKTTVAVLALWDMETGEAERMRPIQLSEFAGLSWSGPDLLVIGDTTSKLFDLKLNRLTASVVIDFSPDINKSLDPFITTDDGTLWKLDTPHLPRNGVGQEWRDMAGPITADENLMVWRPFDIRNTNNPTAAQFLSDDRELISVYDHPIKVTIDVGDAKLAEARSRKVLVKLQKEGFEIGPGGFELYVRAELGRSSHLITLKPGSPTHERAPGIKYVWSLRDRDGVQLWTTTTTGEPNIEGSRYLITDKRGAGFRWDFDGMPMEEAIAKETLEHGDGFDLKLDFPKTFMRFDGKYLTPSKQSEQ